MEEEGIEGEPLIGYNGDGSAASGKSSSSTAITSSLVLGITVAATASFTCGYSVSIRS